MLVVSGIANTFPVFFPALLEEFGGTRATIVALLVRRIAPPDRFGAVFGWPVLGNSVGAARGPVLSGALYDLTGSYLMIYVTAAVLLAASLAALLAFLGTTRETPPPSIR